MIKYILFILFSTQFVYGQDFYIMNSKVIRSILEKSDEEAYLVAHTQLQRKDLSDDDQFDINWVLTRYFLDRNYDSTKYYFSKVKPEQFNSSQVYLFKCLETMYYNTLVEKTKAIESILETDEKHIDDPYLASKYLKANYHLEYGEYQEFQEIFDHIYTSLKKNTNIDNTKSLYRYYNGQRFLCLRILGELRSNNISDDLKYLNLYKTNNNYTIEGKSNEELINLYDSLKLDFTAKSDSLATLLNDKLRIAYGYLFKAIHYRDLKDYKNALKNSEKATQLFQETNSRYISLGNLLTAEIFYKNGNYKKAKVLLLEGLKFEGYEVIKEKVFFKKDLYAILIKIAEKENNLIDANQYYNELNKIKDHQINSILNTNNEYLRQKLKIKDALNKKVLAEKNDKLAQNKKYTTLYFIISFFLLLGLIFLGLYSFQLKKNTSLTKEKNETLQKYNENLKTFTSVISHDLKSPLSSIINLTQLLTFNEISKEEKKTYLDMIARLSNKSIYLINELRTFYKLERGDYNTQHFTSINLHQIINETHDILYAITEKNIVIQNNIPQHTTIQGIKVLIMELFQNLIENAIKYAKEDTDILIELYLKSESNTELKIAIKDYGIGILPENILLIFNKDLQVDSSKSGLGLGLNFCKKIMEIHKGTIGCESEFDSYTEFHLTFKK